MRKVAYKIIFAKITGQIIPADKLVSEEINQFLKKCYKNSKNSCIA